jgi:hypothetical protein
MPHFIEERLRPREESGWIPGPCDQKPCFNYAGCTCFKVVDEVYIPQQQCRGGTRPRKGHGRDTLGSHGRFPPTCSHMHIQAHAHIYSHMHTNMYTWVYTQALGLLTVPEFLPQWTHHAWDQCQGIQGLYGSRKGG